MMVKEGKVAALVENKVQDNMRFITYTVKDSQVDVLKEFEHFR